MNAAISAIWQGSVRHRRFAPRPHAFSHSLFMLGLDLDELPGLEQGRWFAVERAGLLAFRRDDYLRGSEGPLKQAVWDKVAELGGDAEPGGGYCCSATCAASASTSARSTSTSASGRGSPLPAGRGCRTPLEPAPLLPAGSGGARPHDKGFSRLPFMGLAMRYHWRIRPPKEEALIHIESHPVSGEAKLFDATLALRRAPLSRRGWRRCWPAGPG